jgi:hypothetical protein
MKTVLGIKWDERNNFKLAYTRLIQKLKYQEVKSILKHEICHFLSIGTTKIHTIRAAKEYVKYVMIFREYLAHVEFIKRFGFDKWLTSFHRKNLKYYEVILKKARSVKKLSSVEDHQRLLSFFFSILYDAIYFFVINDDSFEDWCQRRALSNLHQVYQWIYEDMKYFKELKISQEEKEKLVQEAAIFPISLDLIALFQENRVKTIKELFDHATNFSAMLSYNPHVRNIAERWIQRFATSSFQ